MGGISRRKKEATYLLNEILGTKIKWYKLSMDELEEICSVLSNPEELCGRLREFSSSEETNDFQKIRKAVRSAITKAGVEILKNWDAPLLRLLKQIVEGD